MALERGTLLNQRYRVVEILGQGGMGAVYRAVDENLGVDVALKENLFTTEEYARQFRREAVILATLRHPNLTRVTDHFVIEGKGQYLVMDYIEGEDLRQRMDRTGVLLDEEAILVGAAVCDALAFLESCNPPVVHRDIKPGNVKITPGGQIYLVDFGLAKVIQGGQATTTGARAMTPGYSPPEQYGTARTDHRSDLFSLGATLYAALTGAIPEDSLARAMGQTDLTPIRKHNPKVSRRLASVVEKSLSIHPNERFQNAEDFKQSLLNVRGFARRKTGEYVVSPAPGNGSSVNSQIFADTPLPQPVSPAGISPGREKSPLPIATSRPLSEPDYASRSKPRKKRRRTWLYLIIAVLAISSAVILYDPSLPTQALALVLPSPTAAQPVVIIADTPTATATQPPTPVPVSPTPSPTTLPVSVSILPTSTTAPAATVPPPTAVPTVIGGGSGLIAFASNRSGTTQVWVMRVDGSDPRQVTNIPEGACQPDWSPDGRLIIFISPCEKNEDQYRGTGLFITAVDGTGLTPLPSVPGGDFDPVWSPDGKKIAFTSVRNSGRPRIYVITLADGSVERLSDQYSYDRQPYWSPDGSQLAFVTTQKGPVQIWTMRSDGSNQTLFSRSADAINSHPVWSIDGEVMLFTQVSRQRRIPGLVAASYKDGEYNEYRYELGPIPAREAKFSPDGLWLVFESWPEGSNHDIYIMSASGANRTRLSDAPGDDFDPVWSPLASAP
jgi:serine/threonine protein kinase/Tol biopolymer transport system component